MRLWSLFAPVPAAWRLGLGEHLGSATMALFACAVWLVTPAGAYAPARAGRRRPAEAALRRLMYGSHRAGTGRRPTGAAPFAHGQRRSCTRTTFSFGEDRMSFSQKRDVTHFSPENRRV